MNFRGDKMEILLQNWLSILFLSRNLYLLLAMKGSIVMKSSRSPDSCTNLAPPYPATVQNIWHRGL